MASIDEFKEAIRILQHVKEGEKIDRFKFTSSESAALDCAIEFMQKSMGEEGEK